VWSPVDEGVGAGHGDEPLAVVELPDPGDRRSVVEPDLEHLIHRYAPAHSVHAAHEIGASVTVRKQIGDEHLSRLRRPAGDQNEGVVNVRARLRALGTERGEQPAPVIL
jgi:hypothetical protein